jgi:hypothetical protein
MERARRQWRSRNKAAGFIEHPEGREVIAGEAARGGGFVVEDCVGGPDQAGGERAGGVKSQL